MTTPSAYQNRINNLRNLARKLAFSPAGAMPPMDPSMMGGAGAPPMDPAMMGGAPMDPSMAGGAPMDPAMMGGAPMDPAMMGGAPMDPSMAGGAPMDPAMMQGDPAAMGGEQQQAPEMMELMDMVQAMGYMLTQICKKLDININPDEQKQQAEDAMLNSDDQAALDAQQADDAEQNQALSDQAQDELDQGQPGYIQDTLNQFEQA